MNYGLVLDRLDYARRDRFYNGSPGDDDDDPLRSRIVLLGEAAGFTPMQFLKAVLLDLLTHPDDEDDG